MGREIRIGLMLTAAACLVAVLVDWAVQELNSEEQQTGAAVPPAAEAGEVSVEAAQEDAGRAQDVTAESHDQG